MIFISLKNFRHWSLGLAVGLVVPPQVLAFTPSQQPPASTSVPGNVVLALSVEFPTGNQVSYSTAYAVGTRYDGYFDNRKCYAYSINDEVFKPVSAQSIANGTCPDASQWSGNLLNWLTMSNLDQFRSVMTGGTRDSFSSISASYPGDTASRTVLIRSFGSNQGSVLSNNPTKNLIVGTPGMPLSGVNKFARSGGYGSKLIVSNADNFPSTLDAQATCAATALPGAADTSSCFNIRVVVCEAVIGVGLEANCNNNYAPNAAKPEGLIQQYANNMRFAALGYLNQNTNRDGAVLRSAMKSVGPMAATTSGVIPNVAKEWNASTGQIYENPDSADAAATITTPASTITNSGLINYLNKFGYSGGYETYDNVSELYYAAQLYLRGRIPPASYSNALTPAITDNFPVITGNNLLRGNTRDPIINSCQKNFILGIGDTHTHCDGNLPGSTNTACTAGTPVDPDGLNVQSLWSTVAGYEGMALTGVADVGAGSGINGGNTPYIVGLAHWAHTNDIRSDLTGKQTIGTYWVDVLESWADNVAAAKLRKTQYWLATKYGGFNTDLVTGDNPNTNRASWDNTNSGTPDNWFAGSSPTLMKAGLSSAFANIALLSGGSSSSAASTSSRQISSSQTLYAGYNPKGWIGTLRSCSPTQTDGQCEASPTWEASQWLKTAAPHPTYITGPALLPSTRKIFTSWRDASFTSMPFQWANLNPAQKTALDPVADGYGLNRVNYLRGDRSNETSLFRKREDTLLGDIVNSGVTYLSGPGPAYSGVNFPGHATYRATTKTRKPVAYVGANDGMLHAFSGSDGKELFGYVPGSVYSTLPNLAKLAFEHKYFVDSTPMVGDIQKFDNNWASVLVGGLGAGGKGYYALNITNQSDFATATEATLSALPMWEFTAAQDADLGFSFNEPSVNPITGAYLQIAKVADASTATGTWRILVGNGYGSTAGKAALFMLDANTGNVSEKLVANGGPNNGLSAPTPVDTDFDGLIDTIYAGDTLGNLHKFQFSKPDGANFVLAKSGDVAGAWRYLGKVFATGQPITTAPSVAPACDGAGWNVTFGTGKLNEDADYSDVASRGYYAVVDKKVSSDLQVSATDIVTIPLVTSTSGSSTVRNWATPNLAGKSGWKMNFTAGERVLTNSTQPPDTGTVVFGITKPTGNICTPGDTGFLMAVNLCTGKTGNIVVDGVEVGGLAIATTGVVKISPSRIDTTGKIVTVCNQPACKPALPGGSSPYQTSKSAPKGRYSWREILTK